MKVTLAYPLVDEILMQYRDIIKNDYQGYRNHVTRVLNFCHYLLPSISAEQSKKLQIAAAFHDIGLWTHDRVDYLIPSYEVSKRYLANHELDEWNDEIQIIIDMHHLISTYKGPYEQLVELFRKADLVDFSLGLVKNGISKEFIKKVKLALPNSSFHVCLGRFTIKQMFRNPLKPAPMIRVKNIYQTKE